jgi:hypothetical protein
LNKQIKEIWQQFSSVHNGIYLEGKYGNEDCVEIHYRGYEIVFDRYIHYQVVGGHSYDTEFTRIRAEFISTNGLKFQISRQGFIDRIGKIFGMQDVRIGNQEFDNKFVVKGNDEFQLKMLFSNDTLVKLLQSQNDIQLEIIDKKGIFDEIIHEDSSMIYYISETKIEEQSQLERLLEIFKALIDELTKLCSMKPRIAST